MTNPQRKQLADLVRGRSGTNAEIADAVNDESVTLVSRFVTSRTLAAELGLIAAGTLLNKLDTAIAASAEPLKSALSAAKGFLSPEAGGIDVGDPATRNQLDLLAQVGFTEEDVEAIKALGERRSLDFTVTADDVASAKDLLNRIAAQEAAHRVLSNDYATRAAVAEAVLTRLNQGELATVVESL